MEVLIVSKTITGRSRCVGGIVLDDNRSVRLEQKDGTYWPANCDLEVGEIWDITFTKRKNLTIPFVEDVLVQNYAYLRDAVPLQRFLLQREKALTNRFWRLPLGETYDGKVSIQANGKAYIEVGDEPSMSTGFWVPDNEWLLLTNEQGKHYYRCRGQEVVYVGDGDPLPRIPAGTLCRLSLARLLRPHPEQSERYYVQLSGWYI